ncbi:MAG: WD40/YVTN/BNR-like repeat-containing protein, partial [Longimicrobiales bacterium]
MRIVLSLLAALLAPASLVAQLAPQRSGTDAEFRAMHAPSADVVWAAGRGGAYAVTTDGGATWRADSVRGAGALFFTGAWAADARAAYLLGTSFDGGLARIYRTSDGGASWTAQWESTAEGVFMDALRCWTVERCIAYGDPLDGALVIVRTTDGRNWSRVAPDRLPQLLEGEAGFAASGTTLTLAGSSLGWIGTGGGARARVYITRDGGASWSAAETPLPGGSTSGIFGIAFRDTANGVAVGGNYERRREEQRNVIRTSDGGRTWTVVGASRPHGVRYGAAYGPTGVLLAAGPSGVGVSHDHGSTWIPLDTTHYNTLAFAPNGTAWLAGPDGRIAKIETATLAREPGTPAQQYP